MKLIITYILLFFYFFSFSQTTQIGDDFDNGSCIFPDTSFTNITACESYEWSGQAYTESGTYYNSIQSTDLIENEFSINFESGNNEFVEIPSTFSLPNDNFTISGKFKSNHIGSVPLFTQYYGMSTSGSSWNILIATTSNTLNCQINGINGEVELNAFFNANNGQWHNFDILYSHEENNFSIYINGLLMANTDQTIGTILNDNNFITHIGALASSAYIGSIDNVKIWDKILSENEIMAYSECTPNGTEPDLIGFWNFEEGSGNIAYDLSGNGNHGSIIGATYSTDVAEDSCIFCNQVEILNLTITQPDTSFTNITACESYEWNGETYTESGIYEYSEQNDNNYSMSFDGDDDQINFGNLDGDFSSNSEFTISYDVKLDGLSQGRIISYRPNTNNGDFGFDIGYWNGNIYFNVNKNNGANSPDAIIYYNDAPLHTWINVVCVYDNGNLKLYINSFLEASTNYNGPLANSSIVSELTFGYSIQETNERFSGLLDNVSIWEKAISEQEIQQYLNCPITGDEEAIVGYWNFEEGQGYISSDLTSNGNNGTINGATYNSEIPEQTCQLTTVNSCDSVAILNLTITQPDTSYTNIIACESYEWNGQTYTESGIYEYSESDSESSMSFDGIDDNISISVGNSIYSISNELTLNAWIKMPSSGNTNSPNGWSAIIGAMNGYGINWYAGGNHPNINGRSQCNLVLNGNIISIESNTDFRDDNWHFLSVTYDGSFLTMYVDGIAENTVSASGALLMNNSSNSFYIGDVNHGPVNERFIGNISSVSIFNKFSEPSEVLGYMQCEPYENEEGLVGYWDFSEISENIIYDLSGNGNDGLINGATYSTDHLETYCNECGTTILDLLIYDNYNTTNTFKICNGESITIGNNTYNTPGSYIDTLTSINGCDSIVNTIIEVFKNDIAQNNITICTGDSISLNSISLNSPSITITLTSTLPSCAWISLNTSFEDYWNDLYGYEYYCSCANGPTYSGCPNIPTGTFITPSEDVNSLGNSIVNAINLNSDYFYATFNALSNELTIYSTVNDISTIEIDGSSWYISGDNSTCPGPCTSLFQSNQNSSNFLWSTGETTQNIIVSPSESTSYNITQYDFDGFSCVDSVLVNVYQSGCNDPSASNYDPNIICIDNSLCTYIIEGCTDQAACNFNPEANLDNGDCIYPETSYTDTSACESYQWNGQTYTESGIYSQLTYDAQNTHSLEFTGNGYVDFGECLDIVPNSSYPITISWKYYPSINYPPTSSNEDYFFTRGISNSSSDYQFMCHYNGTYLRWTGNGANFYDYYVDLVSVPTWSTFSVVIDMNSNPNTIIYHDSEIIASVDIAYNDGSPTGIFKLGQYDSSFNKGFMDDLMIFNKALSQDEIHNYYLCPSSCLENNNIIRYYNFEESTGWVVYDQVPESSNNGNIINSIHWSSLVVPEHSSCQLTTVDGCDSVAVLNLLILDQIEITQNDTAVCIGDSISINVGNIQNNLPINLQSGLVAYYPFNNNANDESENEHHGLINGATIANDRFGNTGKAYYFDGNSTINIENHSDFNLSTTEKLSVSVWAKSTSNQFVSHILGKRTNSIEYQIAWFDNFNSEYGIGYGNWEHCGIPFPLDEWTHLVMTYNNSEWKLFMNGALIHSYFNETSSNSGDLIIGGSAGYTKFIGIIDDVGVWNRELSEIEILEIYNSINQPNYNILWSTGETTNTINVQANETLTYWVNNSCQTDSVEIVVNTPDTTYIEITACDSYDWNGEIYIESGSYTHYSSNESIISDVNDDLFSINFDGSTDSYIFLDNHNISQNFDEITLSAFIKNNGDNNGRIISGGTNNEFVLMIANSPNPNGEIRFIIDSHEINVYYPEIFDNEWHNIIATWDGISMKLYIDGSLSSESTFNFNSIPFDLSKNIHFGIRHLGIGGSIDYTEGLNGNLDNVSIWNRALNESEVLQYSTCSPNGNQDGLLGYWSFEQADNNNLITDLSNNGNHIFVPWPSEIDFIMDVPNQNCQSTCNDIEVLNLVIVDDEQSGCNDPLASNYDPNIICIDNSLCNYIIEGCTDQSACNFDPEANLNNTDCIYPDTIYSYVSACESYHWNGQTYLESGTYYSNNQSINNNSLDFGMCSSQENEHVNFGDILDMPSSFSVGGWIYSDGCNSTILSKREVTSNGYSGFHLTLDNSFSFHIQDEVPGSGDYVSATPIINEWVHIVGVFDAGNIINLYINGTLVDSVATTSFGLSDNNAPFLMGSLQDPGSWSWNGKLDEIFMFNRAISSSEVNYIYNNCNLNSLSGLEAYWNFEQFDGVNVYSQINNSHNGVVNGTLLSLDTPNPNCQSTCNDIEILNLVIVDDEQSGCNDPLASNYDPNVICVDNLLCTYIIEGCTDQEACNFNPSANVENGECIYPSSSEENITVCESYMWNGQTYTESGEYTYTTPNSVGCDSVVYLSLTVNYLSSSFSTVEICNEYQWNDELYTESGEYSYSTINQHGCDSTANLNLTIINCGCTDPIANNYSPEASQDDGNCTYCSFDVNIISQNPSTTNFCDGYFAMTPISGTGPYEYEINGVVSTNFFAPACNDIFNIVISDADNCQFEQTLILSDFIGCTDSLALNYDETALFDDESCIDVVEGCMDENADNYLAEANVDDGNCIFYGCMDQSADNFDETANVDDGSCLYCEINIGALVSQENTSFDCNGYIILSISSSHNPVSIEWDNGMTGGFMNNLCSGDYDYTSTDAQGCVLSGTVTVTGTVEGCTDPLACNYQSVADIDNGSCVYLDDLNVAMNTSEMGHTILTWEPLENVSIYKVYKGTSLDNMQFIGSSFEPNFTESAFNNQSYYYQVSSTVECFGITNEVFSNPVYYNYTSAFSVDVVVTDASCLCCNDGAINFTISGGFPPYNINDIGEQNNLAFGEEKTILVSPAFSGSLFSEVYTIGYDQETYGCMDELAVNYDECVTVDDGSCEYENLSACDITPSGLFVDDIIHNRVVFNWSPPTSAPSHYMIRYRPVGSSSWTVMTAGPVNSNEFTGTKRTRYFMQPGTTYQWNIRARNIDDNGTTICQSPWSASHQFTTLDECPNLVSHFVNTEANWVDFNASDPESIIDVYNSKGKLREVGTNSFRYVNGNTNGIDVRKGNFTPSKDYEWHTKAWCIGNVDIEGNPDPQYHSGWGEFYQFTTQDPCDKMPTDLYTTTNNNQNLITMNWSTPESGAPDHYFLELVNETTGQVFQWNNIAGNATSKTKYNQVPGHEFSWRIRGACGSVGTSWATIFTQLVYYTLGAERVESEIFSDLNVYPNPSRGEFNISFALESRQNVYLSITNYIGEVIFTEELKDQEGQYNKTIDLGDNANGIYMLNIKSINKNINQKIVIQ